MKGLVLRINYTMLKISIAPIVGLGICLGLMSVGTAAALTYDEQMQAAFENCNEGRIEEALQLYDHILAENPVDVDALVRRGFCLLRQRGNFDRARADFQKVVDLTPAYVDAYYGLALIYRRTGEWAKARKVLEQAREHIVGNQEALDYLAYISWRVGHLPLARSIDTMPPGERTLDLRGFRNELFLNSSYDWVEDRPDWYHAGFSYTRHIRPDLNGGFSVHQYRRNDLDDGEIGVHFAYRWNMHLNLEYQGLFGTERNFLAIQKHRPTLTFSLPTFTVVGLGLRLDEYDSGWSEVGRFSVKQYIRIFYGEYTLLTGRDNFDQPVTTHIGRIGFEKDEKLYCHLGYSYGDETLDEFGGSSFSDQLVESFFFNLRYFANNTWGIVLAGGPEYRDSELFRTTAALSIFLRF